MSMGFGFDLMEIMFPLVFFAILGVFVVVLIRNVVEWHHNNGQPRLTVDATVVAKRNEHHHNGQNHTSSTSYYATFQVESGDRMEFYLSGHEYGMLAEGDRGHLSFQGTRYLGFERV